MLLNIRHLTEFRYASPVAGGRMKLRMTPWAGAGQVVKRREISLDGCSLLASFRDHFGNSVELVEVEAGRQKLAVQMQATVETSDDLGLGFADPQEDPPPIYRLETSLTQSGTAIKRLADRIAGADLQDPATLHQLSEHVRSTVPYRPGSTSVRTTAEEAAALGAGVCQDHAHIFVSAARLLGLHARYISGYLKMENCVDQQAMHAWAEVYIRDLGWTGFDISNGTSPVESHSRIAAGRDYADAAPITGVVRGGGEETMSVTISVS